MVYGLVMLSKKFLKCFFYPFKKRYIKDDQLSIEPSLYHALIIIFLEFFSWGLLTSPMITALNATFPQHTFLMNGIIQGIKGLLSFFSAPLIGALSDVWGRKPFLLLTVFFTCSPIPLMHRNSWWFFALISLSGILSVTFSIVFAYVSDITSEENRPISYGLVSATFAASLITSPAIGAYIEKVYGPAMVVRLATLIALIDVLYILFYVPESLSYGGLLNHSNNNNSKTISRKISTAKTMTKNNDKLETQYDPLFVSPDNSSNPDILTCNRYLDQQDSQTTKNVEQSRQIFSHRINNTERDKDSQDNIDSNYESNAELDADDDEFFSESKEENKAFLESQQKFTVKHYNQAVVSKRRRFPMTTTTESTYNNNFHFTWATADPLYQLRKIGKDRTILLLCMTIFFSYLPESGQYSSFFVYLKLIMNFSGEQVASFIAFVGILSVIAQTIILNSLMKILGGKTTILVGLMFEILQLAWYGFASKMWMMWSAGALASLSSITYPAISSYISNHTDPDKQGLVQGLITGIRGLCNGIGPALFGFIFYMFNVDLDDTGMTRVTSSSQQQRLHSFQSNPVLISPNLLHFKPKSSVLSNSSDINTGTNLFKTDLSQSLSQLTNLSHVLQNGQIPFAQNLIVYSTSSLLKKALVKPYYVSYSDKVLPGPPYVFGALLVVLAFILALLIPESAATNIAPVDENYYFRSALYRRSKLQDYKLHPYNDNQSFYSGNINDPLFATYFAPKSLRNTNMMSNKPNYTNHDRTPEKQCKMAPTPPYYALNKNFNNSHSNANLTSIKQPKSVNINNYQNNHTFNPKSDKKEKCLMDENDRVNNNYSNISHYQRLISMLIAKHYNTYIAKNVQTK